MNRIKDMVVSFLLLLFFAQAAGGAVDVNITEVSKLPGSHWDTTVTTGMDTVSLGWVDIGAGLDTVLITYSIYGFPLDPAYGESLYREDSPGDDDTVNVAHHIMEDELMYIMMFTNNSGTWTKRDSAKYFWGNDFPRIGAYFVHNPYGIYTGKIGGESYYDTLYVYNSWTQDWYGWINQSHKQDSIAALLDSLYHINGVDEHRLPHIYCQRAEAFRYNQTLAKATVDSAIYFFGNNADVFSFNGSAETINHAAGKNEDSLNVGPGNTGKFNQVTNGDIRCYAVMYSSLPTTNYEFIQVDSVEDDAGILWVTRKPFKSGIVEATRNKNQLWSSGTSVRAIQARNGTDPDANLYMNLDSDRPYCTVDAEDDSIYWEQFLLRYFLEYYTDSDKGQMPSDGHQMIEGLHNDNWFTHNFKHGKSVDALNDAARYFRSDIDTNYNYFFVANTRMQDNDTSTTDEQYHPTANDTFMNGFMWEEKDFATSDRYSGTIDIMLGSIALMQVHKERHFHASNKKLPFHSVWNNATPEDKYDRLRFNQALSTIFNSERSQKKPLQNPGDFWLDELCVDLDDSTSEFPNPRKINNVDRLWLGKPVDGYTVEMADWSGSDLISDGGAESGNGLWKNANGTTFGRVTDYPKSGTYCMRLHTGGTGSKGWFNESAFDSFQVSTALTAHTLSFWIRANDDRFLRVKVTDQSNTTLRQIDICAPKDSWMQHIIEFTSDGAGEWHRFHVATDGYYHQSACTLYIDDIECYEGQFWKGWSRNFENGFVVLNQTESAQKFAIPAGYSNGVAEITGYIDTDHNAGDTTYAAGDSVEVPATNAYFLIGEHVPEGDITPPTAFNSLTVTAHSVNPDEVQIVGDTTGMGSNTPDSVLVLYRLDEQYPADQDDGNAVELMREAFSSWDLDTTFALPEGISPDTMYASLFGFDNAVPHNFSSAAQDTANFVTGSEATIRIGERATSDYTGHIWDTHIRSGDYSSDNYSDEDNIDIKRSSSADDNHNRIALMKINVGGLTVDLDTMYINDVTLYLYQTNPDIAGTDTIVAYSDSANWADTTTTWATTDGSTAWPTDHGINTALDSVERGGGVEWENDMEMTGDGLRWYLVDVLNSRTGTLLDTMNIAFRDLVVDGRRYGYSSIEHNTQAQRPELKIDYTPSSSPQEFTYFNVTKLYDDYSGTDDSVIVDLGVSNAKCDTMSIRYNTLTIPEQPTDGSSLYAGDYSANLTDTLVCAATGGVKMYFTAFAGNVDGATTYWSVSRVDSVTFSAASPGSPGGLTYIRSFVYALDNDGDVTDTLGIAWGRVGDSELAFADTIEIRGDTASVPDSAHHGTSLYSGAYESHGFKKLNVNALIAKDDTLFVNIFVGRTDVQPVVWGETSDSLLFADTTACNDEGDVDCNGTVEFADTQVLLEALGFSVNADSPLDLDGDSRVTGADLTKASVGIGTCP